MARARSKTCQWASPVTLVNAEGTVRMLAPAWAQCAIERGEAKVVANAHADPAPWGLGHDGPAAGLEHLRFAVALAAGQVRVEHVNLVVVRGDGSLGRDQDRAAGHGLAVEPNGKGAGQQPCPGLYREVAECAQRGMCFLGLGAGANLARVVDHHRDVLGGEDELGATFARRADRRRRGIYVAPHVIARVELDAGEREPRLHYGLRSASSRPARSSATMVSQSPRCRSATKIWGTV